jgi:F-box and WD-40 domain protein 1/11
MAAPAAHRVVPVNDWAPYHEAMYDDGMADSLRAENGSNAGDGLFPAKQRRMTMSSFPWRRRPRSSIFDADGNIVTQLRGLALDQTPDASFEKIPARSIHTRQEVGLKRLFKRASVSFRGKIHRQSIAQQDVSAVQGADLIREATTPRPTTSQSAWRRLRQAASFRNSVLFNSSENDQLPPPAVPVPGNGEQPPIIPQHTGAAAKAAASAHNEYFGFATTPAGAALLRHNNWLSEGQKDDESGIGIALSSPETPEPEAEAVAPAILATEDAVSGISRTDFISQLPPELAIHILSQLDAAGLAVACRVSKAWREVVSNQHIWRESFMREKMGTFATSGPIKPGRGQGVPRVMPENNWREIYKVKEALDKRWKAGKARPVYLNGHQDSIYCLQFDEYVNQRPARLRLRMLTICQIQDHHRLARQDDQDLGHPDFCLPTRHWAS